MLSEEERKDIELVAKINKIFTYNFDNDIKNYIFEVLYRLSQDLRFKDNFKKLTATEITIKNQYFMLQKEHEKELKNKIQKLEEENKKKDKIIDLTIKELKKQFSRSEPCYLYFEVECKKYKTCEECIKNYFERKVEEK